MYFFPDLEGEATERIKMYRSRESRVDAFFVYAVQIVTGAYCSKDLLSVHLFGTITEQYLFAWKAGEDMTYKIAVCDDSNADRAYIADLTQKWAAGAGHGVQLSTFPSAESFLFQYSEESDYDILLLDIEMGVMDGVSLAKRLRQENETVQILFITGYSDYIAEGYEVAALHYLMKPVKEDKLFTVLDRATERLRKAERVLTLELGGEMVRVPLRQIRFVDVHLNYVTVHAKEDYTIKKPLGEIAEALDERFYRVGRSAVVNLTCINRVTKTDIHLNDGSTIPLPRGAYEGINRAIIKME